MTENGTKIVGDVPGDNHDAHDVSTSNVWAGVAAEHGVPRSKATQFIRAEQVEAASILNWHYINCALDYKTQDQLKALKMLQDLGEDGCKYALKVDSKEKLDALKDVNISRRKETIEAIVNAKTDLQLQTINELYRLGISYKHTDDITTPEDLNILKSLQPQTNPLKAFDVGVPIGNATAFTSTVSIEAFTLLHNVGQALKFSSTHALMALKLTNDPALSVRITGETQYQALVVFKQIGYPYPEAVKYRYPTQLAALYKNVTPFLATFFGPISLDALVHGAPQTEAILFEHPSQIDAFKTGKVTTEDALKFINPISVAALNHGLPVQQALKITTPAQLEGIMMNMPFTSAKKLTNMTLKALKAGANPPCVFNVTETFQLEAIKMNVSCNDALGITTSHQLWMLNYSGGNISFALPFSDPIKQEYLNKGGNPLAAQYVTLKSQVEALDLLISHPQTLKFLYGYQVTAVKRGILSPEEAVQAIDWANWTKIQWKSSSYWREDLGSFLTEQGQKLTNTAHSIYYSYVPWAPVIQVGTLFMTMLVGLFTCTMHRHPLNVETPVADTPRSPFSDPGSSQLDLLKTT